MYTGKPMSYLEVARAVLGHAPATEAIYATEGALKEVWDAGGRLVISGGRVRAVRVPPELDRWIAGHEKEVLRALLRHRRAPAISPTPLPTPGPSQRRSRP